MTSQLCGLFNNAQFGTILGFLFLFCLAAVPFAFLIWLYKLFQLYFNIVSNVISSSFFDTPGTSGQVTLAMLLGTRINPYNASIINVMFPNLRIIYLLHRCFPCWSDQHPFEERSNYLLLLSSLGPADRVTNICIYLS